MERNVDLLHGKILPSLTRLALPIMATSLVQMAYNLTDMAWIGRVGSSAVASVGAAGMYTWFSTGIVALAKVGGQVKVAHSLGRGDVRDAAEFGKGAIQLTVILALCYGLATCALAYPLIRFFGLEEGKIVDDAVAYLRIACGLILFTFINQTLTGIFTAMGDSRTPFKANFVGLAVNMALDPILIFGLGFLPKMGVMGAAIATVTAQAIVTIVFLVHVIKDGVLFDKMDMRTFPSPAHFKTIFEIGIPSAVQEALYCGISMVLTRFVAVWGAGAVASQRVGGQIESISWMTAQGFGSAMNAFIGQNYGGRRYGRVKRGYLTASGLMFVWGLFTTAVLVFLARPIFCIFIREPEVIPYGINYLTVIGCGQMFMCMELLTVGALSGMGKTFSCSIISVILTGSRIPLAVILSRSFLGLGGIWWALTISSMAKGVVFFVYYLFILGRLPEQIAQD